MKNICYRLCLLLFSIGLFCACEEEVTLKPDVRILDGIVFDGCITNLAPPYFFRLTYPSCLQENKSWGERMHYENIVGAEIVITDVTTGIKDTLVQPACKPHRDDDLMYVSYYDYHRKKKITGTLYSGNGEGTYVTTRLYGIEGHTYTLDIKFEDKHYSAREMMVPGTPITDLKALEVDLGVKGKTWAPCISFVNRPKEDNYYMLVYSGRSIRDSQFVSLDQVTQSAPGWAFSILSDKYLDEDVKDFLVGEGDAGSGYDPPGSDYYALDSLFVYMMSISKDCYDIYDQMIRQLRTDGGAYTPRPTNIKSNISGGVVWGCFRVSAVTEKGIAVERQ
ncbi:DUF4249 family protein [Bacteroides sp.]|uniref:DUF4249 family protein n=1 Tax=Bacteroides sp. TaxID=29523 RepID=UPI0025C6AD54|nr:DUF4249 family protein [Bacteroides sp.]